MDKPDAAELGRRALKLGLLSPTQLEDARDEAGDRNPDPQAFLRILERKGYLTPFLSGKLLKGDPDGYFLGGYRLLYRISSGSFGRVYRAEDPNTGRIVAVKVLRRRWMEDAKTVEWFYREAKLGMSLRSPNIVEILAVNKDPASKQHYIVMEFVEGGNLREFMQIRKKLSAAEALHLMDDATKGLVYAFARGITHRDMKLTNILISSQGVAKLVDFGLAQISGNLAGRGIGGSGAEESDADQVDRTVDYAGLERATGAVPGDTRSDIYFLGCILYELLTGRSPLLMTKDAKARMNKQRFDSVKAIKREELEAPPSVFNLIETMMSLALQRRYQTPAQLLEAIKGARRDVDGTTATPAQPKKKTGGTGLGKTTSKPEHNRSIFIVERNETAQDKLRDKFKELGYRVFMASDPVRAIERFRIMPYDAVVINAGNVGEDGLIAFNDIMDEAKAKGMQCAGVLILSNEQVEWQSRVGARPGAAVMVPPATLKKLCEKLDELMTA
jgi:serine/threonine protein kinase